LDRLGRAGGAYSQLAHFCGVADDPRAQRLDRRDHRGPRAAPPPWRDGEEVARGEEGTSGWAGAC